MFNRELFDKAIEDSGMKIIAIQAKIGMSRNVWRSRTLGITEFAPSEILVLCSVLNISKTQREAIFGI